MTTKISLGNDGLNLNPIDVEPGAWYYEEKNGLIIYHNGKFIFVIPWRKLIASVKRKESARKESARKEGK
jgi:hypothetical protein